MGKIGAEQAVQREPPGRRQGGCQHRRQQDGQQYIEETEAREYEIVRHRPEGTEAEKRIKGGQNHRRDLIPSLEKADEEKAEPICSHSKH